MTCLADATAALNAFGYTEREARFLYLVATHSGYFLARDYVRFIGSGPGWAVHSLVRRALELGHVREELHSPQGARRFHLFSRVFYRAIGKEHSRNRKHHAVRRINVKLTTLRFVLEHVDACFLEEEPDKLRYFVDELGLDPAVLPARSYQPHRGKAAGTTTRYFVDRFPLLLTPERTPRFTFIDERETTTAAFRTHLLAYLPLLRALPGDGAMLFVSPTRSKLVDAERVFRHVLKSLAPSTDDAELLAYFELRRLWEANELSGFTKESFRARIEGERRFSSAHHDALYQRWLRDEPLHPDTSPGAHGDTAESTPRVSFDTHWIAPGD